jgi:hypothetical protein
MSVQLPEHTPKVRKLLSLLDDDREALMDYYKSGHANTNGLLYATDMFVLGAVKRTLSANAAMILMVQTWNLVTARTLLRTHLDTALRFSAAWLVDDPEKFALDVLNGEQIDRMRDRTGELMKDKYLIGKMIGNHPWLKDVYDTLSGYIHFSGSHITSSLFNVREDGKFSFRLSQYDLNFPEDSWVEVLECFREITGELILHLGGYAATKRLNQ